VEEPEKVFLAEREGALHDAGFAIREGTGGQLWNGLTDQIHGVFFKRLIMAGLCRAEQ
jgi:hypothetical protein